MRDRKNVFFFKAGSGSAFKILVCRIRIRPKMGRIRNTGLSQSKRAVSDSVNNIVVFLLLCGTGR
jgi:hypothetical protein